MVSRLIGIGTSWPSTLAQHPVLVGAPLGEPRQVLEDLARVGVEDVRPVLVDEDAVLVVVVVGVAADVRPLVDDQDLLAGACRQPLREHAAGEAGADDEIVEHTHRPSGRRTSRNSTRSGDARRGRRQRVGRRRCPSPSSPR